MHIVTADLLAAGLTAVTAAAAAAPDVATWAMFLGGFGLIGATMRRRTRPTGVMRLV